MRAIVVGAGVGGLCASIRLAAAGHDVVVLERNPMVGGKLATLEEGGFTFDLGPTVLTAPHVIDDVFRLAGTSLTAEVDIVRLDPQGRYRWPNGSVLEVPDDPRTTPDVVEAFSPGAGAEWTRFRDHLAKVWDRYERTVLAGPVGSSVFGRLRSTVELGRIDGTRSLAKVASSSFDDPRLRQLVHRVAAYSGSTPARVPATAACLLHVEQEYGCWHVTGGLGRLRDALERTATAVGVEVRTGADVGRIDADRGGVSGVELADGGREPADVVVANVDAAHLYTDLLPDPKRARELDKVPRSASAFVLCAAVRGRTDDVAHHNVYFPLHDEQEFRYPASGQLPIDPTVSACVSAVTDRSMAPRDSENWVVVVSTPPAVGIDKKIMTAGVLNRLAERGVDLRDRIEFTRTLVPADFDARYRALGGAIHGSSADGRQAAFDRPGNVGPVHGLYLVGGSTHPGAGLPMVATSARIVADLIADRHA